MDNERKSALGNLMMALLKAGCYLLLFLGCQLLVSVAVTAIVTLLTMVDGSISYELAMEQALSKSALISLLSSLLTLAALVIFFLARKKNILREVGLAKTDLSQVGAAAAITPALYLLVSLVLALFPQSMLDDYNAVSAPLGDANVTLFLATVLAAPLVEEAIFRGLIQSRLERAMPAWLSGLVAALLFGLCHGQILWIIYAFLLGFLFSRMRMTSRSILPSLAAHFVFNLIGFLMVALEPVLSPEAMSGAILAFSVAGLIITRRQLPRLFGFGRGRNPD